ncbi:MAG: hypothetical protein ACLFO2_01470 [Candidatus Woesearchaeota archaeon]
MRPFKLMIAFMLVIELSATVTAVTKDVMLEPRTTTLNDTVEDLFVITNLDHESGRTDSIHVTITYNATWNDGFANGTASKNINKYTASGTGDLTVSGNVTSVLLCGTLETDANDTNPDNDEGCWELSRNLTGTRQEENTSAYEETEGNTTLNETDDTNATIIEEPSTENNTVTGGEPVEEETTDCDPTSITGLPLIVDDGEKLRYGFEPWLDGDEVTYWVEDAFGNTLKKEVTTSIDSRKSYTPRTDEKDTAVIIKAVRVREGCDDSETSAVVVVRGEEGACDVPEEEDDDGPCVCEFSCPECEVPEPFTSLYVRASKHRETITMYGKSEDESLAWLVGAGEARKVAVPEGSFTLDVHPRPGNNTYFLIPVLGGKPRVARFELEGEEEKDNVEECVCEPSAAAQGSFSLPPRQEEESEETSEATGNVVLEAGNDGSGIITVLAGAAGFLILAATGMQRFKKKNRLQSDYVTRDEDGSEGDQTAGG